MDEPTRQRYKSIIAAEMKQHRPQDGEVVNSIVDRLFVMPQMQDERDVLVFIDEYRKAVARGVGNGIQ